MLVHIPTCVQTRIHISAHAKEIPKVFLVGEERLFGWPLMFYLYPKPCKVHSGKAHYKLGMLGDAVRSGILRVLQLHKVPLPFTPLVLSVRESQSSKDLVPATEQWFATGEFTSYTPALVSTAQRLNPLAASVTFTFSFS